MKLDKSDLRQIVRHLALPEGAKYLAVDKNGSLYSFRKRPKPKRAVWSHESAERITMYGHGFKPQPNWRELCISVEGE